MSIDKNALRNDEAVQNFYLSLSQNPALWSDSLLTALQTICKETSKTMAVGRVSIWSLNRQSLVCLNLFDEVKNSNLADMELASKQFPAYFAALHKGRLIDAHDAMTDPRTNEFAQTYLKPLGIGAMLDATLRIAGTTSGVLCLEHVGGPRLWTKEEKSLARVLADLIAQVIGHHELRDTVNRYESILKNMPSAAYRCLYDSDWTMQYMSPGIEKITGYKASDFINNHVRSYASVVLPKDLYQIHETLEEAATYHRPFETKYRIQHKNGSQRWISEFGQIASDPQTGQVWIDGVINDITEQRTAEHFRHEQQDLVARISQSIARSSGDSLLKTLVVELADVLQVTYAFVGQYIPEPSPSIETITVCRNGEIQPNFVYELRDTPCEKVLENGLCDFPSGVQERFPKDHLLKEMDIQAYLGARLMDGKGNILGILVVLGTSPFHNIKLGTELLKIFAVRAGAELERLHTESALRDNQTHYQSLFESAGDAILILKDGMFTDCNPMATRMFGCTKEQFVHRSPAEFSPTRQPDGQTSTEKAIEKISAAMSGEIQHFSWEYLRLDKTPFEAEVTLTRIERKGEIHILGVVRDVSETKRAQRQIIQHRDRLLASIEAMPGIYYMFDKTGNVVFSNKAFQRFFNKTEEQLKNGGALFAIHEEDHLRVNKEMSSVLMNDSTMAMEFRVYDGNGDVKWLYATGSRLLVDEQPYIVGAAIDITLRVEAVENLELSQIALEQRNKILQQANSLSNHLHGSLDEKEIYQFTAQSFAQLPAQPQIVVFEFNDVTNTMRVVSSQNVLAELIQTDINIPLAGSLAEQAFKERRVMVCDNILADERQSADLRKLKAKYFGITAELSIPIFDNDRALGVVCAYYQSPQEFSELDLSTLESMAKNIAAALNNARHARALEHQAKHDSLTGLPNRKALKAAITAGLTTATEERVLALMLIDLDHFKEVNDTLGHDIGDKIICTIGPRLKRILDGHNCILGRLGGDEFALVFTGIAPDDIPLRAEEIIQAIRKPFWVAGITLDLNASIGITTSQEDINDEKEMLRRADIAMYHAKKKGGGIRFYSDDIDTHSREKLAIMAELRKALEENEFVFHFQPKINIKDNKIIGAEALVRWQHPRRGLLFPDAFIDLIEVSDLIHSLTKVVLINAMRQLQVWHKTGIDLTLSVNVSTKNLLDGDFANSVKQLCQKYRIEPRYLELEITENSLITDPERVKTILDSLTALGVKLSIDDFGTGYSSLAYLKRLPIHALKIDRTFVMDMENDHLDEKIVASTVAMAHSLNLEVVAEGVETEAALEKLRGMGCDQAQGYFFSRPLPIDQFNDLLKD